ncbi:site-specific tyrosine recombinase XerD [Amnibacterium sp. CER49]|uniref:site-specific tyrosine recombinase XerD n=1 Tax=Amnibacterium sp. CER49 TaxID=3039161 RepID=UPI00244AE069|nr:site-specific tyrosine recombinase XerD [Amnibacterium sp. CER49]MDH2444941.1 site-specific tyrosine recombinase XerD [Amnibacterium sp. CER49]
MLIGTAASRFLRHVAVERGLADNTLAAYRRDLARYEAHLADLGRTDIEQVTDEDVSGFLAAVRRDDGMAATSAARMLSTVRGLHRFLAEDGVVREDVARETAPPKQPMRLPKAITIDEMARLIAATDGDDPVLIRDKALLELLYATGTRVSEAVGLDVDDLSTGELVRVLGKGGKQRLVPLGSYARTAVEGYLTRVRPVFAARGAATPALFLGPRGARLSRQGAWLVIQAAAERSGLTAHVSPHTFRHSFATHLLQGGADVRVVQELLGHASVATTQLYTLVTADTLRDVYTTSHPRAR